MASAKAVHSTNNFHNSFRTTISKVECQTAIIDQFADEKLLLEKLQEQGKKLKVIQAYRAESHIAVAAASILARERFLNKLNNLGKQYHTK